MEKSPFLFGVWLESRVLGLEIGTGGLRISEQTDTLGSASKTCHRAGVGKCVTTAHFVVGRVWRIDRADWVRIGADELHISSC